MSGVRRLGTRRVRRATAALLLGLIVLAGTFTATRTLLRPTIITAEFATTSAIYPGDEVRVAGVKVGSIASITPAGTLTRMVLSVDRDVPIPLDARAVVVAPNAVSARYVQLAPSYVSDGPTMSSGAVIPMDRTAVPVEWDEVKQQLTRLADDLGPTATATPAVSRFIDSAANAMAGNGDKLRQTLAQLAGVARTLADGGGDIATTIRQLQTFVGTIADSKQQIVQFQNGLATLSSVLDGGRTDLDQALRNLSEAVGEVRHFLSNTRDATAEQVRRLADVTQNLVDHRMDLEQVLHVAPTSLVNTYNMFDPRTGAAAGEFVLNNFSDMNGVFCGMVAAVANVTAAESAKICEQTLGPALKRVNANYLPVPINPVQIGVPPWQDLIYSEARLVPGGDGPKPVTVADVPPAVSAFTGAPGDTPAVNAGPVADSPGNPSVMPTMAPSPPTVPSPEQEPAPTTPLPAERPTP